jgi:multicomponent Na+:H+ antiporter subunit B
MKKLRRAAVRLMEILLILLLGLFLFLSLRGEHPQGTPVREHIVSHGTEETGALNLVTAIYLGYRAFDTLGETIVLLLAVSGVLLFTERKE